MKAFFMNKTFSVVTPESSENGDFAETGFVYEHVEFASLWHVAREIREACATEPSSSVIHRNMWYQTTDPEVNYRTGAETYFAFHPADLTEEETQELDRLIKIDRKSFAQLEPNQ